jgi:hypothetical protein
MAFVAQAQGQYLLVEVGLIEEHIQRGILRQNRSRGDHKNFLWNLLWFSGLGRCLERRIFPDQTIDKADNFASIVLALGLR